MHEYASVTTPVRLPSTLQGCRERLASLQDEIASIRIQIATTDIRRQTEKKSLDATWFHRAKTALRLKQQELSQLTSHMVKLNAAEPGGHRERFKDALIEVLRADCDEERWQAAVTRARELHAKQGVQHG
jgi:hypothetical protein